MRNLKSISSILFFAIFIFAFKSDSNIPFKKIEGYKLMEGKQPGSGFVGLIFVRDRQFEMFFKKEEVKGKSSIKIDFEKSTLITLMGQKTNLETTLSIEKILRKANKMEVYFTSKIGKKTKKTFYPSCLYSIEKQEKIHGLAYYLDGKLLEDVQN